MRTISSREILQLPGSVRSEPPSLSIEYLSEPFLRFGTQGLHVDPKSGLSRYGPYSLGTPQHPSTIRVGIIGTAELSSDTQGWLQRGCAGVRGDKNNLGFPGFANDRGFFSSLSFAPAWNAVITQTELSDLYAIRKQRDRFTAAVGLLHRKLELVAQRDQPPEYLLIVISDEMFRKCGVADYFDADEGAVHRDLRRAIKAMAMRYRIPTQLLRQRVIEGRDASPASKVAWNFFTGLYHKAGGFPWMPVGLPSRTCFVGISFYKPLGSRRSRLQTSLVQAFDDRGDSLILRGREFEWDAEREESRSPHLNEDQAHELISLVLTRYEQEVGSRPVRVVVQKSSRYWPAERAGFIAALRHKVAQFDLVALEGRQSHVRLITASKYPPLRGTRFTLGNLDYLYTTGFIAALNEFHGMHVPSPNLVADHVGQDTPRQQLLAEILALTKLNWNSAGFAGKLPVTLRFAELVGEIMKEIPDNQDPLAQFKFYI